VTPDLTCLSKVIGGGLPVGAYGGRADLMDQLAPNGPVYQAGTLSGNPLAVAAGLATLDLLEKDGSYERLEELGRRLGDGLAQALALAGNGCVQRVGSMLTLFFGVAGVADYDDALSLDAEAYGRFFHAMLDRGVWLPPSGYEAWFVSTVHSDEHVDRAVEAAGSAMAEIL
jgi:glutamate-1-semialdehyde 2,1-aminomutase